MLQSPPPSCHLQKISSSPLQFGLEENLLGHSFERRTYFERYQCIPSSHRQRRKTMMNTLLIVNISPICKREFRGKIYSVSCFPFYLMQGKTRKLFCISTKQIIFCCETHNSSVNKLTKNYSLVMLKIAKYC